MPFTRTRVHFGGTVDGAYLGPVSNGVESGPSEEAAADTVLVELVDDSLQARRSIGSAFTRWAGGESVLRVAFVPEMFVAVDREDRRGYLYNDIVRVQCWIERGAAAFSEVLAQEFSWSSTPAYEVAGHDADMVDLIDPVVSEGITIDDARHLE